MDMYIRQKDLNLKLDMSITIIGLGGIGSWLAVDLAMAGINKINLIDYDTIEEHNLNRTLFKLSDIGKTKTNAVLSLIAERRDATEVLIYNKKVEDLDNAELEDIKNTIIIDCRDNTLNLKLKPYIKLGYDGFKTTIHFNPDYNKIFGEDRTAYINSPSFLCPPQMIASLITLSVVTGQFINEDKIINKDVREYLKVFGGV